MSSAVPSAPSKRAIAARHRKECARLRLAVDLFAREHHARVVLEAFGDFSPHYALSTPFGELVFSAHGDWIASRWRDVGKSGHIHGFHPSGKWNHGPFPRWHEFGGDYSDAMESFVSGLRRFGAIA